MRQQDRYVPPSTFIVGTTAAAATIAGDGRVPVAGIEDGSTPCSDDRTKLSGSCLKNVCSAGDELI
jgi:hypothetical protein